MDTSNSSRPRSPLLSRRQALGAIGTLGAGAMFWTDLDALAGAPAASRAPAPRPTPGCVVTPQQTEGPYFIDERLDRSDVRADPATGALSAGIPLRLRFAVARVDGSTCSPVTGAHVDIWQCDALGVYSDVRDFQGLFDTTGKKFLRGFQVTDRTGLATFLTIYPGWYAGRAVHIHFKVRLFEGARRAHEFTSQLYFDEAVTDEVHAQAPYSAKGRRDTLNTSDGIYRRSGGAVLVVPVTRSEGGYEGAFSVGLRIA